MSLRRLVARTPTTPSQPLISRSVSNLRSRALMPMAGVCCCYLDHRTSAQGKAPATKKQRSRRATTGLGTVRSALTPKPYCLSPAPVRPKMQTCSPHPDPSFDNPPRRPQNSRSVGQVLRYEAAAWTFCLSCRESRFLLDWKFEMGDRSLHFAFAEKIRVALFGH